MPETKPRRWFQIHLSTAIVLMFVAGVLVWANVRVPEDNARWFFHYEYEPEPETNSYRNGYLVKYGFPMPAFTVDHFRRTRQTTEGAWEHVDRAVLHSPIAAGAVVNLLFALAVLAVTTIACECAMGRWRRRQP